MPRAALALTIVAMVAGTSALAQPEGDRSSSKRPVLHFSAEKNWINDPNGLVFLGGEYHLFFQHNPQGTNWGNIGWGHAVSSDLIRWRQLPLALPATDAAMIYSGSIVFDGANSSGLGAMGQAPLVSIYTAHDIAPGGRERQHIAYSLDKGRTWMDYGSNPVLDIGLADFRDPKVFWHATTKRWIMVVALAREPSIAVFGSPNLREWEELSRFQMPARAEEVWECPDLFELPLPDGKGTAWVLKVDTHYARGTGASDARYLVGAFDGKRFTPSSDRVDWVDAGTDFYAAASWSNIAQSDGRRIWIAWMNNWRYASKLPTTPWRGMMTIPREVSLQKHDGELVLSQRPVRELWRYVDDTAPFVSMLVRQGRPRRLDTTVPFILSFKLDGARTGGFRMDLGDGASIRFDATQSKLAISRPSWVGSTDDGAFAKTITIPVRRAGREARFDVIVDHQSIELFDASGTQTVSMLTAPGLLLAPIALHATGAGQHVVALRLSAPQSRPTVQSETGLE